MKPHSLFLLSLLLIATQIDELMSLHYHHRYAKAKVANAKTLERVKQIENDKHAAFSGKVQPRSGTLDDCLTISDPCVPYGQERYRRYDGSCNNFQHPGWGAAGTHLRRMLPANYCDSVQEPRCSVNSGAPLPNAREISNFVHNNLEFVSIEPMYTLMVMQWGQFLDHDITLTPIIDDFSWNGPIQCCDPSHPDSSNIRKCLSIEIDPSDIIYPDTPCIDVLRSVDIRCFAAGAGPREQLNQITGFIDASNVYGSSEEEATVLRQGENGLLKETEGQLLPSRPLSDCFEPAQHCYRAGDERANEQIGLTTMHTIWMREHNRIAKELAQFAPSWNDEKLFQETRRIIGAMMQVITYNEFLPVVLGRKTPSPFYQGYDPELDPSITNEFATAAFRFGHTLLSSIYHAYGDVFKELRLRDTFFKPDEMFDTGPTWLTYGLIIDSSERADSHLTEDVQDHLFQLEGDNFGLDLAALNIQRGRDHGMPTYNDMRDLAGLQRGSSIDDFWREIGSRNRQLLKDAYGDNPDDIDLFTGGIAEAPMRRALVGPTFGFILNQQFEAVRSGDSFWYERRPSDTSGSAHPWFNADQISELRKTRLSGIFCSNLDMIFAPRNVMRQTFDWSLCDDHRKINLALFAPPLCSDC